MMNNSLVFLGVVFSTKAYFCLGQFQSKTAFVSNFSGCFIADGFLDHIRYSRYIVYELLACIQRANENAGNLISVVQFFD